MKNTTRYGRFYWPWAALGLLWAVVGCQPYSDAEVDGAASEMHGRNGVVPVAGKFLVVTRNNIEESVEKLTSSRYPEIQMDGLTSGQVVEVLRLAKNPVDIAIRRTTLDSAIADALSSLPTSLEFLSMRVSETSPSNWIKTVFGNRKMSIVYLYVDGGLPSDNIGGDPIAADSLVVITNTIEAVKTLIGEQAKRGYRIKLIVSDENLESATLMLREGGLLNRQSKDGYSLVTVEVSKSGRFDSYFDK